MSSKSLEFINWLNNELQSLAGQHCGLKVCVCVKSFIRIELQSCCKILEKQPHPQRKSGIVWTRTRLSDVTLKIRGREKSWGCWMSKSVFSAASALNSLAYFWFCSERRGREHRKAGIYEEEGCDRRKWEGSTGERKAQKELRRPRDGYKPSSAATEEA